MWFLAAVVLFVSYFVQSEHIFGAFNVQPSDKTFYYQKKWQKYKCTFTYQAQGERKEQWQFIMEKLDDDKMLRCTVSRGTTSYLTFENFTISLTGPKVHIKEFDATSYLETRLDPSEYKMSKKRKTVYAVKGKFQKKLERVTLTAKIKKKKKKVEL